MVNPSAIAPKRSARCEIDLSPGTLTRPFSTPPDRSMRDEALVLRTLKAWEASYLFDFIVLGGL